MSRGQQLINGTNGRLYLDGEPLASAVSVELKISGEFETASTLGDYGQYVSYGGYSVEGTITRLKVDSSFSEDIIRGFIEGTPKYYYLVFEMENKYTGAKETWEVDGVVFTELSATFERGQVIEDELPFKAETVAISETL